MGSRGRRSFEGELPGCSQADPGQRLLPVSSRGRMFVVHLPVSSIDEIRDIVSIVQTLIPDPVVLVVSARRWCG